MENTMKYQKYGKLPQIGFTLFDALITLAIISILLSLGIPAFSDFLAKAESRHVSHTTHRMLAAARESAMDLERKIKFCGIDKTLECTNEGFSQLAIFVDYNKDSILDDNDTLILVRDLSYSGNSKLSASLGKKYIQFKEDGSASQAGSIIYCHPSYVHFSSRITVSMPGRSYIARDLNGDGIVELTSGKPISC